jgi:hypothetical protein
MKVREEANRSSSVIKMGGSDSSTGSGNSLSRRKVLRKGRPQPSPSPPFTEWGVVVVEEKRLRMPEESPKLDEETSNGRHLNHTLNVLQVHGSAVGGTGT